MTSRVGAVRTAVGVTDHWVRVREVAGSNPAAPTVE